MPQSRTAPRVGDYFELLCLTLLLCHKLHDYEIVNMALASEANNTGKDEEDLLKKMAVLR